MKAIKLKSGEWFAWCSYYILPHWKTKEVDLILNLYRSKERTKVRGCLGKSPLAAIAKLNKILDENGWTK